MDRKQGDRQVPPAAPHWVAAAVGAARRVGHPARLPPAPQNCGVVVEAHVIDERSEWRTFADKASRRGARGVLAGAGCPPLPRPPLLRLLWLPNSLIRWAACWAGKRQPSAPSRLLPRCCSSCSLPPSGRLSTRPASAQDGGAGADPNRVGGPVNHLLSDGGMSTMIGGAKGVDHALVGCTAPGSRAQGVQFGEALPL